MWRPLRRLLAILPIAVTTATSVAFLGAGKGLAADPLIRLSVDPYSGDGGQHATEVEPDSFAAGSTIVTAFQAGRFLEGGGSSNIGWATSTDAGSTWSSGVPAGDHDGRRGAPTTGPAIPAWPTTLRTTSGWSRPLPITGPECCGDAVAVSRSTDGGLTWGAPVMVAIAGSSNAVPTWTRTGSSVTAHRPVPTSAGATPSGSTWCPAAC